MELGNLKKTEAIAKERGTKHLDHVHPRKTEHNREPTTIIRLKINDFNQQTNQKKKLNRIK